MSGAVQRSNQGPIIYRASSALPAAGAYETGAVVRLSEYLTKANLLVTYTRGAGGGYMVMRPTWQHNTAGGSLGTDYTYALDTTIVAAPTLTGQVGEVPLGTLVIKCPTPDGAGAVSFEVPLIVPGGAVGLRVDVAEAGAVGTPGTCRIDLSTFSE